MEQEAAAIKHDGSHTGFLRGFGNILADLRGGGHVSARHLDPKRAGSSERAPIGIVDDLRVDVLASAVHRQSLAVTRTLAQRGTDTATTAFEQRELCHVTSSSLPCGR